MQELPRAIENYRAAADLFEQLKMPKWAALGLWALSACYAHDRQLEKTCSSLKELKDIYPVDLPNDPPPSEKGEFFSQARVDADLKRYSCEPAVVPTPKISPSSTKKRK